MDILTVDSQRLVHLDFKGAPPRVSYLEKLFPLLRDLGATGLLIEWEDTFPYTKELEPIGGLSLGAQALGAPYSIEEAKQILVLAADCGLSVIPLVQTFGHMEFILKHDQWRDLREVEHFPSSMCPSNSQSLPLVCSLIRQIVAFHTDITYLHIGADEVWHMGICSNCERRMSSSKHGKHDLYLEHLRNVAQYIREQYPSLKIIIWDDMLRNIDTSVLQEYGIGSLVEPMVWHYNSSETFKLGGNLWDKYSNIFSHVWAASAFKGATGSCQIVPNSRYHLSNHEAWLNELSAHGGKIQSFRGLVFTGWSRYDHYATICELLPCAIPTLALCMKTWLSGGYTDDVLIFVNKMLGYTDPTFQLEYPPRPFPIATQLTFPGWHVLVAIEWLLNIKCKYKNIVESDQMQTWFNTWQIRNNYTNPMQIESLLPILKDLHADASSLEIFLKNQLDTHFYTPVSDEIIGTLLVPIIQHIERLKTDCEIQCQSGCRPRGLKPKII